MAIKGFTARRIEANGIGIALHEGGAGSPVILLHGFPQNHRCWARVAPVLAARHRVIVPDLRGYGDSDAPPDDAAHACYSKREMARDIVALLDAIGLPRAAVIGHDRGARVAYRMALDHPARVSRLGILEVVPTGDFWAAWNADLALSAYHWTFLAQEAPIPETLIGADPRGYLDWMLASWTGAKSLAPFDAEALASYRAQMADPQRRSAMCADYRAGATIDRRIDEADIDAGARIDVPVHFLWAEAGFPARTGAPLEIWSRWAHEVTGMMVGATGHFMPEEAPEAVAASLLAWLEGAP